MAGSAPAICWSKAKDKKKEFERPAGVRVEDTLKKALLPLLKATQQAAGRVKKDSEMSEVEM